MEASGQSFVEEALRSRKGKGVWEGWEGWGPAGPRSWKDTSAGQARGDHGRITATARSRGGGPWQGSDPLHPGFGVWEQRARGWGSIDITPRPRSVPSPLGEMAPLQLPGRPISPPGRAHRPPGGAPLLRPTEPALSCCPCSSEPGPTVVAPREGPRTLLDSSSSSGFRSSEQAGLTSLSPALITAPQLVWVPPPVSLQDQELRKTEPWVPKVPAPLRGQFRALQGLRQISHQFMPSFLGSSNPDCLLCPGCWEHPSRGRSPQELWSQPSRVPSAGSPQREPVCCHSKVKPLLVGPLGETGLPAGRRTPWPCPLQTRLAF